MISVYYIGIKYPESLLKRAIAISFDVVSYTMVYRAALSALLGNLIPNHLKPAQTCLSATVGKLGFSPFPLATSH